MDTVHHDHTDSGGMSALVAVIAIIAILAVAYGAYQLFLSQNADDTITPAGIDITIDGGSVSS